MSHNLLPPPSDDPAAEPEVVGVPLSVPLALPVVDLTEPVDIPPELRAAPVPGEAEPSAADAAAKTEHTTPEAAEAGISRTWAPIGGKMSSSDTPQAGPPKAPPVDNETATVVLGEGDARPVDPASEPTTLVAPPAAATPVLPAAPVPTTPVPATGSAAQSARDSRSRALGVVAPTPEVIVAPEKFQLPTTYLKLPSLALLILRYSVMALMGIRCWRDIVGFDYLQQLWANTIVPIQPQVMAWGQIGLEGLVALLLFVGLGTRIAGVVATLLAVLWLTFVLWGVVSPFTDGVPGFTGEFELLLAGAGLALFGLGGGGWLSVDAIFHRARIERKNEKIS